MSYNTAGLISEISEEIAA